MASVLLSTRSVLPLSQRASRTARPAAFHSRPKPFTASRRVFAKAAQVDDDEELDSGVEAEALVIEVGRDAEDELDFEGFEDAVEAGKLLEDAEDPLTILAVAQEMDATEEEKKAAAAAYELALARKLDSGEATAEDLEALLELVGDDDVEAVEIEEFAAAQNSDKYEDEPVTLSEQEEVQVAKLKLSASELRNLLPQDWDALNVDFFGSKKDENIPLPEFRLNVLWMEKNIAVAVDQVYSRGQTSPLTEYFFWPRNDAWEEMKSSLETRPWINERDKIVLLNRLTQLINFWQDEQAKRSVDEARSEFPDCSFSSA